MRVSSTEKPLPFVKMQALGNDFVVLDGHLALPELNPAMLRKLADRRHGVGCDQILVLDPAPNAEVDFGYRIYNADGTTVGQCGNGARALAIYAQRRGLSQKPVLRVQTQTTRMRLQLQDDGEVAVEMPVPQFAADQVPLRREQADSYTFGSLVCGAVSMGNPHLVTVVENIDTAPVSEYGPVLASHADLPEGANIGFAQILAEDHVRLRVHERGAGETPACGSGACGAIAILRNWGRVGSDVRVELRGGSLRIRWPGGDAPLWMIGPAEWVYEGQIEL